MFSTLNYALTTTGAPDETQLAKKIAVNTKKFNFFSNCHSTGAPVMESAICRVKNTLFRANFRLVQFEII